MVIGFDCLIVLFCIFLYLVVSLGFVTLGLVVVVEYCVCALWLGFEICAWVFPDLVCLLVSLSF